MSQTQPSVGFSHGLKFEAVNLTAIPPPPTRLLHASLHRDSSLLDPQPRLAGRAAADGRCRTQDGAVTVCLECAKLIRGE